MDDVKELREYIDKIESLISKEKNPIFKKTYQRKCCLAYRLPTGAFTSNTQKLAHKMVHVLREIFGYNYGSFLLIEEQSNTLKPLAFFDEEETSSAHKKLGLTTLSI